MPLSEHEEDYVERFLTCADGHNLDEWSTNFVASIRESFETYGKDMRLSFKQWAVIYRIADKMGMSHEKP